MGRFLHVVNGGSLAGLIDAAGIPGERSVWCDVLYEGPVPGGLSDDALLEVRARFLSDGTDEDFERTVRGLRGWRSVMADTHAYDELVLWYEHDLFDQLNLVQLLSWIHDRLPRSRTVSLVSIGAFPDRPHFKGMGELTPAELAPLIDARRPVSTPQFELAGLAWNAFREDTPEALDAFQRADLSALPFLAAALRRFLEEYPWTSDGLSRSERRALQVAELGPIALAKAFPRMHDGESSYYITDSSFASLVESLSRRATPLLEFSKGDAEHVHGLNGTMSLTDAGRRALAGTPDVARTTAIDRWMGGVHLEPGRLWHWNADDEQMTRA